MEVKNEIFCAANPGDIFFLFCDLCMYSMYNGILGHFSLCPWPIGHARMKSSAPRNGHASFFSLFASTRVLHYDISLQSRRVCNLFYAVDALAMYFGTVKVSAIILVPVIVPHQKENPAKLFN